MDQRTALITGASSGIGLELAADAYRPRAPRSDGRITRWRGMMLVRDQPLPALLPQTYRKASVTFLRRAPSW
jgi:hypothetical protein